MNGTIHLNEVVVSFDFTELSRVQRNYSEGSLSQRRRLGKSMANLRQLVEFKGAVQSVHKFASDNPHIRLAYAELKVGLRRAKGSVNPQKMKATTGGNTIFVTKKEKKRRITIIVKIQSL